MSVGRCFPVSQRPVDKGNHMSEINQKLHRKVQQAIDNLERESTDPRILITGATGAGKSSLINCIFGKKLQALNTVASTTRSFTTHPYEIEKETTVHITDSPGYGEIGYDEQYSRDVVAEAKRSHVMSLVLKADEKGYDRDLKIIGMAYPYGEDTLPRRRPCRWLGWLQGRGAQHSPARASAS